MKNLILFLGFFLCMKNLLSQNLQVGSDLLQENLVQFIDQHGNLQTISKDLKYLLFVSDMDASKVVHPYLLKLKQEGMNLKKLALIADIHKMPTVISKMIAIPKMKEYPYIIHLILDNTRGAYFPKEKGKVFILFLENYKVQKIERVDSQVELEKIIQ